MLKRRRSVQDPRFVRILSNIKDLPGESGSGQAVSNTYMELTGYREAWRIHRASFRHDAVVLYQPNRMVCLLCLLRLLTPTRLPRLIVVDIVLKPARSRGETCVCCLKRLLFKSIDLFMQHVKDTTRLEKHYGITGDRNEYTPWKVNSLGVIKEMRVDEGSYVFTGGRSWRDYNTFCRALSLLDYPAIILTPDREENLFHGTRLGTFDIPPNVQLIHDDGTAASWIGHIARCKIMVLTLCEDTVSAAGVGAYLLAMALHKPVIITECPAVNGILENNEHAIIVPPGDPLALADAIDHLWRDAALRRNIQKRGYEYATSLGGAENFRRNVADQVTRYVLSV